MKREFPLFKELRFYTADEIWDELSPTNKRLNGGVSYIFRGQADATWPLIPSILRARNQPPVISSDRKVDAGMMVHLELLYLTNFAKHCDSLGIAIPNDSQQFRKDVLISSKPSRFIEEPALWPDERLLDLMAMAQHHGVPTRLLDWTTKAYAAAYFAASSTLSRFADWREDDRLAIWALNIDRVHRHSEIVMHRSPGSISRHLAAQGGLFSVHPHSGERRGSFLIKGLEEYLSDTVESPLLKITLPVFEASSLLRLCTIAGFSGAYIYPTADGAGRAVIDEMNVDGAASKWNAEKNLVKY